MNTLCESKVRRSRWLALLCGGALMWTAGLLAPASAQTATNPPAPAAGEELNNSITLSTGGWLLRGNPAQFQSRQGLRSGPFGGIEEFHYEQLLTNNALLKFDGRALQDDYEARMELALPDQGYFRAGYKQFRIWSDGTGGWYPGNGRYFTLFDDRLALDRGQAWFEAGWTPPEGPLLVFRYDYLFRHGLKDSTAWGDTVLTGLAVPNNIRKIAPAFWDLDEKRHVIKADAKHTVGRSELGFGARFDLAENDNARKERRNPGEATDRRITHREQFNSDLMNFHAHSETRLHENVLFTTGYSFTRLDTDISGSRIYGADYDVTDPTLFPTLGATDEGFLALTGGSELYQHVLNLSLALTPWADVTIVPTIRVERFDSEGVANFVETAGPQPVARTPMANTRSRDYLDVSQRLEVRYTGWTNWVVYARGEWLEGEGTLAEREYDLSTGAIGVARDTDSERFTQKYSAGANWYPLRRLNLAAQYYHKQRQNTYFHRYDTTANTGGNRYPAFLRDQDFTTDDTNLRVTWRPLPNLTSVSRYDFQLSTVNTRPDLLASVQSAEMTTHIFSQSLSWSPLARWYLQGTLNYAMDRTDTPAQALGGTAAGIVLPARNGYWTASLASGFALNEKTDLQALYNYYRADNLVLNSAVAQPYGASAEEHGVTLSMIRRLTKNLVWTLRYGFFRNRDTTFGGINDYEAHLVYSGWQYRF